MIKLLTRWWRWLRVTLARPRVEKVQQSLATDAKERMEMWLMAHRLQAELEVVRRRRAERR